MESLFNECKVSATTASLLELVKSFYEFSAWEHLKDFTNQEIKLTHHATLHMMHCGDSITSGLFVPEPSESNSEETSFKSE